MSYLRNEYPWIDWTIGQPKLVERHRRLARSRAATIGEATIYSFIDAQQTRQALPGLRRTNGSMHEPHTQ
jgi:hypothetical protein